MVTPEAGKAHEKVYVPTLFFIKVGFEHFNITGENRSLTSDVTQPSFTAIALIYLFETPFCNNSPELQAVPVEGVGSTKEASSVAVV